MFISVILKKSLNEFLEKMIKMVKKDKKKLIKIKDIIDNSFTFKCPICKSSVRVNKDGKFYLVLCDEKFIDKLIRLRKLELKSNRKS